MASSDVGNAQTGQRDPRTGRVIPELRQERPVVPVLREPPLEPSFLERVVEAAKTLPGRAISAVHKAVVGAVFGDDNLASEYKQRAEQIADASSLLRQELDRANARQLAPGSLAERLREEGLDDFIKHPSLYLARESTPDPSDVTRQGQTKVGAGIKAAVRTFLTIDEWLGGFALGPIADVIAGRKPQMSGSLTIPEFVQRSYPGGAEEMIQRVQEAEGPEIAKQLGPAIRAMFGAILTPLALVGGGPVRGAKAAKEASEFITLERMQKNLPRGILSHAPDSPDLNLIRGAEAKRLEEDPEALRRLNFNVQGTRFEAAVRDLPYKVRVRLKAADLYDLEKDPLGIGAEFMSKGGLNEVERQIKQRGFKGYIAEDGRAAVFEDRIPVAQRFKRKGRGFVEVPDFSPEHVREITSDTLRAFEATGRQGATVSVKRGNLDGEDAWAVSIFSDARETVIQGRPVEAKDIEDFIVRNQDLLADDRVAIGLWTDDAGAVHLEPSVLVKDRAEAERLAKQFDQQGLFHLRTHEYVPTGGTGKPDPTTLPPVSERLGLLAGTPTPTAEAPLVRLPLRTEGATEAATPGAAPGVAVPAPLDQTRAHHLPPVEDELRRLVAENATELTVRGRNQLANVGAAVIHRFGEEISQRKFEKELRAVLDDRIARLLTPEDMAALYTKSQERYAKLVKNIALDTIPAVRELGRIYRAGEFNKRWYDAFRPAVERVFGTEPITLPNGVQTTNAEMFARFFAATSPQVPVQENIRLALEAFADWKAGRPFSNPYPHHVGNLERAAKGLPFSDFSPKVQSFFLNLWGDQFAVTADSWIGRLFGLGDNNLKRGKYQFIQEVVRQEAARIGVTPREYQAALWVGFKLKVGDVAGAETDLITQITRFLDEHPEQVPEDIRALQDLLRAKNLKDGGLDEQGIASLPAVLMLARAVAGFTSGVVGSHALGDDEHQVRNGLIAAGLAAFATPQNVSRLVKLLNEQRLRPEDRVPFLATEGRTLTTRQAEQAWTPQQVFELYNQELKDYRREGRTFKQVFDEADMMVNYGHVNPEFIRALAPGAILNEEHTVAANMVLVQGFQKLVGMAHRTDPKDPAAVEELLKQLVILGSLDIRRMAVASEQGAALNINKATQAAFPQLQQIQALVSRAQAGTDPARLIELIKALPGPNETLVFARAAAKPKFKDMLIEAWVNGILSGLKTLTVNAVGNPAFLLWNTGERAIARLYQDPKGVVSGEARELLLGVMEAFADSAKLAWQLFREDRSAETVASKLDQSRHAITAENVNDLFVMRRLGLALNGPLARAVDYVGAAVRLPGRALIATDEFFKGIAFRAELRARALREAFAEGEARGLSGSEIQEFVRQRQTELILNPPDDIADAARQFASYVTFQKELGPIGQALKEITKQSALAKATVPFITAPVNIMKAGFIERTPLAVVSKEFREAMTRGGADADVAMARLATGSMVMAWLGYLAAAGVITGSGPTDYRAKKIMQDNGWLPGSINISKLFRIARGQIDDSPEPRKGDRFIEIDRLDPLGLQMVLAADFARIAGQLSPEDREGLAVALAMAAAKSATSRTWVRGAAEVLAMAADPEQYAETKLRRFAGTFAPFSSFLESVTRTIDPTVRQAQSILDEYKKKLYPFAKDVIPDRDIFGNPRVYPPGFGPDILSPFYSNTFKDHPVFTALQEDDVVIRPVSRTLEGIRLEDHEWDRLRVLAAAKRDELSPDVFRRVAIRGKTYEEAMLEVIDFAKRTGRSTGPDSWRAQEFRRVTEEYTRRAREQLLREFPDLAEAVASARAEKRDTIRLPAEQPELLVR